MDRISLLLKENRMTGVAAGTGLGKNLSAQFPKIPPAVTLSLPKLTQIAPPIQKRVALLPYQQNLG
jgi:hypothetical protein